MLVRKIFIVTGEGIKFNNLARKENLKIQKAQKVKEQQQAQVDEKKNDQQSPQVQEDFEYKLYSSLTDQWHIVNINDFVHHRLSPRLNTLLVVDVHKEVKNGVFNVDVRIPSNSTSKKAGETITVSSDLLQLAQIYSYVMFIFMY